MAWVDIGLLLVEKILGGAIRAETARFIVSDPGASEARYFPGFAPKQAHGDTAVLKAQEWVHIRDGRVVSLASMAAASGLERRTFLRRFANATGMTPIEYCGARVSSSSPRTRLKRKSPSPSGMRTSLHSPGSFARRLGLRQEPTGRSSAVPRRLRVSWRRPPQRPSYES